MFFKLQTSTLSHCLGTLASVELGSLSVLICTILIKSKFTSSFSLHSSTQHMMPFTLALITWQVMWPPKVRHCYPGIWDHWNVKNLVIVSSEPASPAVSPTACVSLLTVGWTCPFPGKLSPQGLTILSSQCILLHPARVTAQKQTLKCSSHSLKS